MSESPTLVAQFDAFVEAVGGYGGQCATPPHVLAPSAEFSEVITAMRRRLVGTEKALEFLAGGPLTPPVSVVDLDDLCRAVAAMQGHHRAIAHLLRQVLSLNAPTPREAGAEKATHAVTYLRNVLRGLRARNDPQSLAMTNAIADIEDALATARPDAASASVTEAMRADADRCYSVLSLLHYQHRRIMPDDEHREWVRDAMNAADRLQTTLRALAAPRDAGREEALLTAVTTAYNYLNAMERPEPFAGYYDAGELDGYFGNVDEALNALRAARSGG